MKKQVVILGGLGDSGQRLARRLVNSGYQDVVATTRKRTDAIHPARVVEWKPFEDDLGELITQPDAVVINLIGAWLKDARRALVDTTQLILDSIPDTATYVHCGAISVYGTQPGRVLDEASRTTPNQRVAAFHLEAEAVVEKHKQAWVLRLPHIYGPGRERTFDLLCEGKFAVAGDGDNHMHHLHAADFARILQLCVSLNPDGVELINVVDNGGPTYGEYCDFITSEVGYSPVPRVSLDEAKEFGVFARHLGPHFEKSEVLEEFFAFMTSDIRLDNTRARHRFGEFNYPTCFDGLREMVVESRGVLKLA